jgi:heat-inducible transcriptional repressor
MLTPRQELLLSKVIDVYTSGGQPVGSKLLSADVAWGPSTVRGELATLEERGLLAHPHTSAGRVPTDAGYRYFVDRLLPEAHEPSLELSLVRREVDEAMRVTTETLCQVTDLLAIVSAPPIDTATIRHVEVLLLQPQVLMVVVITSTGGVSKRMFTFDAPVDSGLASWAASYLNERLAGVGLGARLLGKRLSEPALGAAERAFLARLTPAFTDLEGAAEETVYVEGAAHLLAGQHGMGDVAQLEQVMDLLERRVALLGVLRAALGTYDDVHVSIGRENQTPALHGFALVAAGYGLPTRSLGMVSVIGPLAMDYGRVIGAVRTVASQLSHFIADVYEEA